MLLTVHLGCMAGRWGGLGGIVLIVVVVGAGGDRGADRDGCMRSIRDTGHGKFFERSVEGMEADVMSEVERSMRRVTGILHSHQNSRSGIEQIRHRRDKGFNNACICNSAATFDYVRD